MSQSMDNSEDHTADGRSNDSDGGEETSSEEEEVPDSESPPRKKAVRSGKAKNKKDTKGKGPQDEVEGINKVEKVALLKSDNDYVMGVDRRSKPLKINLSYKNTIMSDRLMSLGEELAPTFRESCFGSLLDFSVKKTSSQLLLHLVQRQCKPKKFPDLTFKIGGKYLRFGIEEFCMITRLNCGHIPKIDKASIKGGGKVKREYFDGTDVIKRTMLNTIFKFNKKGSDEEKIKVALLYCLESFFLSKQEGVAISNDHMMDDLELFNQYPWGRVAYQLLVTTIRSVGTTKRNCTVGMNGLVYALLAWAYEVIPALSSAPFYYATRTGTLLPRILNWDLGAQPEWCDLLASIFENPSIEVHPIVASDEELTMPYFAPFLANELAARERNSPTVGVRQNSSNVYPGTSSIPPMTVEVARRLNIIEQTIGCVRGELTMLVAEVKEIGRQITVLCKRDVNTTEEHTLEHIPEVRDSEEGDKDEVEPTTVATDDHAEHKTNRRGDKDDEDGFSGGHDPSKAVHVVPVSHIMPTSEAAATRLGVSSAAGRQHDHDEATLDEDIRNINERAVLNKLNALQRMEECKRKCAGKNLQSPGPVGLGKAVTIRGPNQTCPVRQPLKEVEQNVRQGSHNNASTTSGFGAYVEAVRGGNWPKSKPDLPKEFKGPNFDLHLSRRTFLNGFVVDCEFDCVFIGGNLLASF